MKRLDRKSAFGDTPEQFEQRLFHALHQEDAPMRKKSLPAIVIAAVLIVLLAATAYAVMSRLGLLDFVDHYDPENGADISGMIATDVMQTGGETESATYTVREAFYDGRKAHIVFAVMPKEEDVALMDELDRDFPLLRKEAQEHGSEIIYVRCDFGSPEDVMHPAISWRVLREGPALIYGYEITLPEDYEEDVLRVGFDCGLLAEDEYVQPYEETAVQIEVPKTTMSDRLDIPLDIDMELARITSLSLSVTPLEMTTHFTMEPIQTKNPWLHLLDTDGQELRSSNGRSRYDEDSKVVHDENTWASTGGMPERLILWIEGAPHVAVIELPSGETKRYPVEIEFTPEKRTIHIQYEEELP